MGGSGSIPAIPPPPTTVPPQFYLLGNGANSFFTGNFQVDVPGAVCLNQWRFPMATTQDYSTLDPRGEGNFRVLHDCPGVTGIWTPLARTYTFNPVFKVVSGNDPQIVLTENELSAATNFQYPGMLCSVWPFDSITGQEQPSIPTATLAGGKEHDYPFKGYEWTLLSSSTGSVDLSPYATLMRYSGRIIIAWSKNTVPADLTAPMAYETVVEFQVPRKNLIMASPRGTAMGQVCTAPYFDEVPNVICKKGACNMPGRMYIGSKFNKICYDNAYGLVRMSDMNPALTCDADLATASQAIYFGGTGNCAGIKDSTGNVVPASSLKGFGVWTYVPKVRESLWMHTPGFYMTSGTDYWTSNSLGVWLINWGISLSNCKRLCEASPRCRSLEWTPDGCALWEFKVELGMTLKAVSGRYFHWRKLGLAAAPVPRATPGTHILNYMCRGYFMNGDDNPYTRIGVRLGIRHPILIQDEPQDHLVAQGFVTEVCGANLNQAPFASIAKMENQGFAFNNKDADAYDVSNPFGLTPVSGYLYRGWSSGDAELKISLTLTGYGYLRTRVKNPYSPPHSVSSALHVKLNGDYLDILVGGQEASVESWFNDGDTLTYQETHGIIEIHSLTFRCARKETPRLCSDHIGCSGLAGNCCPDNSGKMQGCCHQFADTLDFLDTRIWTIGGNQAADPKVKFTNADMLVGTGLSGSAFIRSTGPHRLIRDWGYAGYEIVIYLSFLHQGHAGTDVCLSLVKSSSEALWLAASSVGNWRFCARPGTKHYYGPSTTRTSTCGSGAQSIEWKITLQGSGAIIFSDSRCPGVDETYVEPKSTSPLYVLIGADGVGYATFYKFGIDHHLGYPMTPRITCCGDTVSTKIVPKLLAGSFGAPSIWIPPAATCANVVDGATEYSIESPLAVSISPTSISLATLGTQRVTYTCTSAAGRRSVKNRDVEVVHPIFLTGGSSVRARADPLMKWVEPGVECYGIRETSEFLHEFHWPYLGASSVKVQGEWDGWSSFFDLARQADGTFKKTKRLTAKHGGILYKFQVDGVWMEDPKVPMLGSGYAQQQNNVIPPLSVADVFCSNGVRSGNVCCGPCDGLCGGAQCGTRTGGSSQCCTGAIQGTGVVCTSSRQTACVGTPMWEELYELPASSITSSPTAASVDVTTAGVSRQVTYTCTNNGLSVTARRSIEVVPRAVLVGAAEIFYQVGAAWMDPGIACADVDGSHLPYTAFLVYKGVHCGSNRVGIMRMFTATWGNDEAKLAACLAYCHREASCKACSVDCISATDCRWNAIPSCGPFGSYSGSIIGDIALKATSVGIGNSVPSTWYFVYICTDSASVSYTFQRRLVYSIGGPFVRTRGCKTCLLLANDERYVDPGAECVDGNGQLLNAPSVFKFDQTGSTVSVFYTCTTPYGFNTGTRTIKVNTPPTLMIQGERSVMTSFGRTYLDAGAICRDSEDGTVPTWGSTGLGADAEMPVWRVTVSSQSLVLSGTPEDTFDKDSNGYKSCLVMKQGAKVVLDLGTTRVISFLYLYGFITQAKVTVGHEQNLCAAGTPPCYLDGPRIQVGCAQQVAGRTVTIVDGADAVAGWTLCQVDVYGSVGPAAPSRFQVQATPLGCTAASGEYKLTDSLDVLGATYTMVKAATSYVKLGASVSGCPAGDEIPTKEECQDAVQALGLTTKAVVDCPVCGGAPRYCTYQTSLNAPVFILGAVVPAANAVHMPVCRSAVAMPAVPPTLQKWLLPGTAPGPLDADRWELRIGSTVVAYARGGEIAPPSSSWAIGAPCTSVKLVFDRDDACTWLFGHTGSTAYMCNDGTSQTSASGCSARGGIARCPSNLPALRGDGTCAARSVVDRQCTQTSSPGTPGSKMARLQVINMVNVNVEGTFKVAYICEDSFGAVAGATREVYVGCESPNPEGPFGGNRVYCTSPPGASHSTSSWLKCSQSCLLQAIEVCQAYEWFPATQMCVYMVDCPGRYFTDKLGGNDRFAAYCRRMKPPLKMTVTDGIAFVSQNRAYVDPGCICEDDGLKFPCDTNQGMSLNVILPGAYTITYKCTDGNGLVSTRSRIVTVKASCQRPTSAELVALEASSGDATWNVGKICAQGAVFYDFMAACTIKCPFGYTPDVNTVTCSSASLVDLNTFWSPKIPKCVGNPCSEPSSIDGATTFPDGKPRPCVESRGDGLVSDGGPCTPSCIVGFFPSLDVPLTCKNSVLMPMSFSCKVKASSPDAVFKRSAGFTDILLQWSGGAPNDCIFAGWGLEGRGPVVSLGESTSAGTWGPMQGCLGAISPSSRDVQQCNVTGLAEGGWFQFRVRETCTNINLNSGFTESSVVRVRWVEPPAVILSVPDPDVVMEAAPEQLMVLYSVPVDMTVSSSIKLMLIRTETSTCPGNTTIVTGPEIRPGPAARPGIAGLTGRTVLVFKPPVAFVVPGCLYQFILDSSLVWTAEQPAKPSKFHAFNFTVVHIPPTFEFAKVTKQVLTKSGIDVTFRVLWDLAATYTCSISPVEATQFPLLAAGVQENVSGALSYGGGNVKPVWGVIPNYTVGYMNQTKDKTPEEFTVLGMVPSKQYTIQCSGYKYKVPYISTRCRGVSCPISSVVTEGDESTDFDFALVDFLVVCPGRDIVTNSERQQNRSKGQLGLGLVLMTQAYEKTCLPAGTKLRPGTEATLGARVNITPSSRYATLKYKAGPWVGCIFKKPSLGSGALLLQSRLNFTICSHASEVEGQAKYPCTEYSYQVTCVDSLFSVSAIQVAGRKVNVGRRLQLEPRVSDPHESWLPERSTPTRHLADENVTVVDLPAIDVNTVITLKLSGESGFDFSTVGVTLGSNLDGYAQTVLLVGDQLSIRAHGMGLHLPLVIFFLGVNFDTGCQVSFNPPMFTALYRQFQLSTPAPPCIVNLTTQVLPSWQNNGWGANPGDYMLLSVKKANATDAEELCFGTQTWVGWTQVTCRMQVAPLSNLVVSLYLKDYGTGSWEKVTEPNVSDVVAFAPPVMTTLRQGTRTKTVLGYAAKDAEPEIEIVGTEAFPRVEDVNLKGAAFRGYELFLVQRDAQEVPVCKSITWESTSKLRCKVFGCYSLLDVADNPPVFLQFGDLRMPSPILNALGLPEMVVNAVSPNEATDVGVFHFVLTGLELGEPPPQNQPFDKACTVKDKYDVVTRKVRFFRRLPELMIGMARCEVIRHTDEALECRTTGPLRAAREPAPPNSFLPGLIVWEKDVLVSSKGLRFDAELKIKTKLFRCPNGQFRVDHDRASCGTCELGSFSNADKNDNNWPLVCTVCPLGTFQDQAGGSDCIACPDNTETVAKASSIKDCRCTPGHYSPVWTEDLLTGLPGYACTKCSSDDVLAEAADPELMCGSQVPIQPTCQDPEVSTCSAASGYNFRLCKLGCPGGTALPVAKPYFFLLDPVKVTGTVGARGLEYKPIAVRCTPKNACDFGNRCSSGYSGSLCSLCAVGYYRDKVNKECMMCDSDQLIGTMLMIGAALTMTIGSFFFALVHLKYLSDPAFATSVKTTVAFYTKRIPKLDVGEFIFHLTKRRVKIEFNKFRVGSYLPFRKNRDVGIVWRVDDVSHVVWVAGVREGSPAHALGVKKNWRLVLVNGKRFAPASQEDLNKQITKMTLPVRMTFWAKRQFRDNGGIMDNNSLDHLPRVLTMLLGVLQSFNCMVSLGLRWPETFKKIATIMQKLLLNFDVFHPECSVQTSYEQKWFMLCCIPYMLITPLVLSFLIISAQMLYTRRNSEVEHETKKVQNWLLRNSMFRTCLTVVLLCIQNHMEQLTSPFTCIVREDGNKWLVRAPEIPCSTKDERYRFLLYGGAFFWFNLISLYSLVIFCMHQAFDWQVGVRDRTLIPFYVAIVEGSTSGMKGYIGAVRSRVFSNIVAIKAYPRSQLMMSEAEVADLDDGALQILAKVATERPDAGERGWSKEEERAAVIIQQQARVLMAKRKVAVVKTTADPEQHRAAAQRAEEASQKWCEDQAQAAKMSRAAVLIQAHCRRKQAQNNFQKLKDPELHQAAVLIRRIERPAQGQEEGDPRKALVNPSRREAGEENLNLASVRLECTKAQKGFSERGVWRWPDKVEGSFLSFGWVLIVNTFMRQALLQGSGAVGSTFSNIKGVGSAAQSVVFLINFVLIINVCPYTQMDLNIEEGVLVGMLALMTTVSFFRELLLDHKDIKDFPGAMKGISRFVDFLTVVFVGVVIWVLVQNLLRILSAVTRIPNQEESLNHAFYNRFLESEAAMAVNDPASRAFTQALVDMRVEHDIWDNDRNLMVRLLAEVDMLVQASGIDAEQAVQMEELIKKITDPYCKHLKMQRILKMHHNKGHDTAVQLRRLEALATKKEDEQRFKRNGTERERLAQLKKVPIPLSRKEKAAQKHADEDQTELLTGTQVVTRRRAAVTADTMLQPLDVAHQASMPVMPNDDDHGVQDPPPLVASTSSRGVASGVAGRCSDARSAKGGVASGGSHASSRKVLSSQGVASGVAGGCSDAGTAKIGVANKVSYANKRKERIRESPGSVLHAVQEEADEAAATKFQAAVRPGQSVKEANILKEVREKDDSQILPGVSYGSKPMKQDAIDRTVVPVSPETAKTRNSVDVKKQSPEAAGSSKFAAAASTPARHAKALGTKSTPAGRHKIKSSHDHDLERPDEGNRSDRHSASASKSKGKVSVPSSEASTKYSDGGVVQLNSSHAQKHSSRFAFDGGVVQNHASDVGIVQKHASDGGFPNFVDVKKQSPEAAGSSKFAGAASTPARHARAVGTKPTSVGKHKIESSHDPDEGNGSDHPSASASKSKSKLSVPISEATTNYSDGGVVQQHRSHVQKHSSRVAHSSSGQSHSNHHHP